MNPPRPDLRQSHTHRPLTAEFHVSPEADGSVKLDHGKTCVIVSIYGPSPPKYTRHEKYDKASLEIDYRTCSSGLISGDQRIQMEKHVSETLHSLFAATIKLAAYPRKLVVIRICVIRDDGCVVSACINACSLALMHSGIAMVQLPVSVSCAMSKTDHHFLLDPCSEEEVSSQAVFSFTYINTKSTPCGQDELSLSVAQSKSVGIFTLDQLQMAMTNCENASITVRGLIRELISQVLMK